jgi:uncharacterized protein (TIRG00374 family)
LSAPSQAGAPTGSRVLRLIGYGIAVSCLFYVLHDIHPGRVLRDLGNVSWKWVLLGMLLEVLSYWVQGLRWALLLRPFGRVQVMRAVRAVYAGLFTNLVFPLRPGEVLRSYELSKSEDISFGRVLGSVGVERLIDLVVAVAALGAVSLFLPQDLPLRFKHLADLLGKITLVVVAILVAVILYLETQLPDDDVVHIKFKWGRNLLELTESPKPTTGKCMSALVGLHAMGTSPSFYLAVLGSVLMPLLQVLALWAMMQSYGPALHLPFRAAVVVLLIINLGVSLPNAPGNVGSYQFFCVLGLNVFQVEKTTAAGFSIFAFVALTLPILFLGVAAAMRSGLSVRHMRAEIRSLPREGRKASA